MIFRYIFPIRGTIRFIYLRLSYRRNIDHNSSCMVFISTWHFFKFKQIIHCRSEIDGDWLNYFPLFCTGETESISHSTSPQNIFIFCIKIYVFIKSFAHANKSQQQPTTCKNINLVVSWKTEDRHQLVWKHRRIYWNSWKSCSVF